MPQEQTLDITGDVCPLTFVRAKLAIEALLPGQVLKVRLAGDAVQNVPRSLRFEGHKVLSLERQEDGSYLMLVLKEGTR